MSILSKLFGGGTPKAPEPEVHAGFRIFPEPIREGGGFRLAARIEREIDGEMKSHRIIRADVFQSQDEAVTFSTAKAKQLIDQMGVDLFG